ncbi:MAG: glutamate 5-kinase [Gammaproteobacteria bacterium]|nr:MAG: glutamate 5-kinase [Gammaproteobacteria bacterium]
MSERELLVQSRRWVIKAGSALLTNDGKGLDAQVIRELVTQMAALREAGCEVILVSSGAVAAGVSRLKWAQRPTALHELQAAAAVGQMGLAQAWESAFAKYRLQTAQILLSHDDISARDRYLNARSTLTTLLSYGVIPVVNENDTVITDEIRFGDNDTLAAMVANLVDADALLLLTDQVGLFDADPREVPSAKLIAEASAHDPALDAVAGEGGVLGRGGMITKLRAARLAARSGTQTVIAGGRETDVITRVRRGDNLGTWLRAGEQPQAARKRWLASQVQVKGVVTLDAGAVAVLKSSGKSLLPVGVVAVSGGFSRGDMISCRDELGVEVARGLSNYSVQEANKIKRLPSSAVAQTLGYVGDEELIHRDNLLVF